MSKTHYSSRLQESGEVTSMYWHWAYWHWLSVRSRSAATIQLSFTSQKWAVHSLTTNVSAAISTYICSRAYMYVRRYTQHVSLDPPEVMKICQQINIRIENFTAYSVPWSILWFILVLWSIFAINRTCMHSYSYVMLYWFIYHTYS